MKCTLRSFVDLVQPGALQVFQAVFCHAADIGVGIIEEWFDQGLGGPVDGKM